MIQSAMKQGAMIALIVALAAVLATGPALAQKDGKDAPAGKWSYPHVCFLDGKAFSVGAQTCNTTRGKPGSRLLECQAGEKKTDPARWKVASHAC